MADFSRRQLLIGAAAMAGAAAAFGAGPLARAMPGDQFSALENQYNVRIGVFAANLVNPAQITYQADYRFAMCSTFKGYVGGRVLQGVDRGQLDLDTPIPVTAGDILPNSPVTEAAVGRTLTIRELCVGVLQRSDNAGANLLMRQIGGPPAVTAFARDCGDTVTRLDRWETELNTAYPGDDRDTSSPAGLATGFQTMLTGQVLSDPSRTQLVEWMKGNVTSSMRPGLPPAWTTADKTGGGDYNSTNDVGLAYGPNGERLMLAFMTRTRTDDPKVPNNRALIGELAATVLPMIL